ncbi:MAG TPA: hypothetical protein VJL83_05450 [Patescibacteria group bacterium]|nr:hypothetical protein [Patescibacteria group bacterium]
MDREQRWQYLANRYEELIGSDDKPRDELGYLYIQFTIHTLHALMEKTAF